MRLNKIIIITHNSSSKAKLSIPYIFNILFFPTSKVLRFTKVSNPSITSILFSDKYNSSNEVKCFNPSPIFVNRFAY